MTTRMTTTMRMTRTTRTRRRRNLFAKMLKMTKYTSLPNGNRLVMTYYILPVNLKMVEPSSATQYFSYLKSDAYCFGLY